MDQPIPKERLKELYPLLLELKLDEANIKLAVAEFEKKKEALQTGVNLAFKEAGADSNRWQFDLKTGAMFPLPPPEEKGNEAA